MPIDDTNWSAVWTEMGANMAYKDTMRHRADPTSHIGPHVMAAPYSPPYLKGGEEEIQKCLTCLDDVPVLPAPAGETRCLARQDDNTSLARGECQHVLPGPLIDRAVGATKGGAKMLWYSSPEREQWVSYQLRRVPEMMMWRRFDTAAHTLAEVFGTLLPGLLRCTLSPAEQQGFAKAWEALQSLVEPQRFLDGVLGEMHRCNNNSGLSTSMRVRMELLRDRKDNQIGPVVLQLAERMQATEKRIEELQRAIDETGIPPGNEFDNVLPDMLPLGSLRSGVHAFRLMGRGMVFPALDNVCGFVNCSERYAWWIVDRAAPPGQRGLRLLRLRKYWFDRINRVVDGAGVNLDDDALPNLYIKIDELDSAPSKAVVWMGSTLHRATMHERRLRHMVSKDRVLSYYNGRRDVEERMRGLVEQRDKLAEQYAAATGAGHDQP